MTELPPARVARMVGALYLIQMATGVFGFAVRSSLTVRGDASQTAQNILISERLFRVSILTDIATFAAVLLLTWALYVLLRSFNRDLALLASFLRIIEIAVLSAATVSLLLALALLRGAPYQNALPATELHSLVRLLVSAQAQAHTLAFIFLGLGSSVFAYLLLKSRYIPRALAGWGVFASLLLALGSCAVVLFPGATQMIQMVSMGPMGLYEVGLGAWLLFRGVRI